MRREALSHPVAIAGVLVTTASAVVFLTLVIAMLAGLLENPYAGLVVFVAIPLCFVAGLTLIPAGVWLRGRALARDPQTVPDWPVVDFRRASVRRTALAIAALTAVNAVILLLAGYGTLHWMESPVFCGQACHTEMQPQFVAWRSGPHSRVACVDCHIGDGARGFLHAKLSGVRQLVHVATGGYPTPIPPGADMEPGAHALTCGRCHRPGPSAGDHFRTLREYASDEANAETKTVLLMHLGRGSSSGRAIHWHAEPGTRIEYVAADQQKTTIPYVRVIGAGGHATEFVAEGVTAASMRGGRRRVMDCIDCHNTAGHPMAQTPEQAVDRAIGAARTTGALPYLRREGVRLLGASYETQDAAAHAIDRGLRSFYQSRGGVDGDALARAVADLQDAYRRAVFPSMRVAWGSYPDNKGHVASPGCFRCHDGLHTSSEGKTISGDCEYCHSQVEGAP